MNLSNAVFLFLQDEIDNAAPVDLAKHAELQESLYQNKVEKITIRVGDVQESLPKQKADGVREANAFLTILILVRPDKQDIEGRLAARQTASQIALNIAGWIFRSNGEQSLGGRVCTCDVVRKMDDWANIATVRYAVSYLQLEINHE